MPPSAVYTVQFISRKGLHGNATYTVPAGFVAVVRDASIYMNSLSQGDFFLHGPSGEAVMWQSVAVNSQAYQHLETRVVYDEGQTISVLVDLAPGDNGDVNVAGYLFAK